MCGQVSEQIRLFFGFGAWRGVATVWDDRYGPMGRLEITNSPISSDFELLPHPGLIKGVNSAKIREISPDARPRRTHQKTAADGTKRARFSAEQVMPRVSVVKHGIRTSDYYEPGIFPSN